MKLMKIKFALFGITAGMTLLGLGACIGDLVADTISLRGVD
jgi:hypothetical protein